MSRVSMWDDGNVLIYYVTDTNHPDERKHVMYTDTNYRTKKALREAVAAGERVTVHSPGPFPCPTDGSVSLEGPHYPEPHRWYASAVLADGAIVSVK